jgi:pimeloyl-ACP methyl ester carboxylesterase
MKARTGQLELEYEVLGDPGGVPLLLIMGLGSQLIVWDDAFCQKLVERGFRVIRYDNRDVGLSTKLDAAPRVELAAAFFARLAGRPVPAPYTLSDLAEDAVGLLDALDIARAHVAGVSMGGMIGQELAIHHPERVLSLASMMSSTGELDLPGPTSEAIAVLLRPVPRDRERYIEHSVRALRTLGSPRYPRTDEELAERARRAFDRSFYPRGFVRHLLAIWASGGRRQALAAVRVPTVVIHGSADPLIPLDCGLDTARAIPGAEFCVIEGMGHDLPPPVWPRVVGAIAANAQRGGAQLVVPPAPPALGAD